MRWPSLFVLAMLAAAPGFAGGRLDQTVVDKLTRAAYNGCLVGSQYLLKAEAGGSVTFSNMKKPGGQADVTVDGRFGKGAVGHFNEKVRDTAERRTVNCLKPYTDKIFDYILVKSELPKKQDRIKGNLAVSHIDAVSPNDPDEGWVAQSCADADVADGWHIVKGSGHLVLDSHRFASEQMLSKEETEDHFCVEFRAIRPQSKHGLADGWEGHAEALVER